MLSSSPIHNIVINAATHGNEMSGIAAVKHWQKHPDQVNKQAPSANIQLSLINQAAMNANKRFIDEDLNRQFTLSALNQNTNVEVHEHQLAQSFNQQFGPKHSPKTDLIIDIHNTTSNMGPTLIILVNDDFHQQLARFVKQQMPESIILIEDYQDYGEFGYLCTVAKHGVMIEVGPQAQGVLKAKAYRETITMTQAILQFIELYNTGAELSLPPTEAFRLGKEISYPTSNENGVLKKSALIHESLDGQDFCLLQTGMPCFYTLTGETINWQEPNTYPHFIGESAYDHLNIAFATSDKCWF